ncbi:formate hydrogenase, partial [Streptomyces sp. FH025]|nr:formate hydrogenase [Streptomyces sp. FH025]
MPRTTIDLEPGELPERTARLLADGHRLALVAAHHDDPATVRVVYLFLQGPPDTRTELHVRLDAGAPAVPT